MWVYGLLIVFVFILLLLSVIYLVKLTYKVVSKKINNKLLSWILSCFPLLFFGIGLYIDLVNAIVVDIHLIVIIFIIKQFFKLIKKYTNKEINEFVILGIGIIISTIVLFRGYYLAHNVSETNYVIYTTKDIGTDDFKIVQISDSHIGTTMDGKKFTNYMNDINKITGANFKPFNYYGANDASEVIVAMGSVCDTIRETVDYLNRHNKK